MYIRAHAVSVSIQVELGDGCKAKNGIKSAIGKLAVANTAKRCAGRNATATSWPNRVAMRVGSKPSGCFSSLVLILQPRFMTYLLSRNEIRWRFAHQDVRAETGAHYVKAKKNLEWRFRVKMWQWLAYTLKRVNR
jgi:hypothetical protein